MKDFRARRWQQEDRNPMMTVFEKAGRYPDIIDLSIGDPDLKTPQKIIDLAFADAGAGHTKYTDPWGDPELREEIARFYAEEYGVALGEREIFVSTAGCVAMYLVMEAILDPGDEVLIFDPYFSAYATQVRLGGGVPVFVPCREADGWQPDMERVCVIPDRRWRRWRALPGRTTCWWWRMIFTPAFVTASHFCLF